MGQNSINEQVDQQQLKLRSIYLRFQLPANAIISSGGYTDPTVATQDHCTVELCLNQSALGIYIDPPLIINPFFVSKYAFKGLTYTFKAKSGVAWAKNRSGSMDPIHVQVGGITAVMIEAVSTFNPLRPHDTVVSEISGTFLKLIRGTRYAGPNYHPLDDRDPLGGLHEIRVNMMRSTGSTTTHLQPHQIRLFDAGVSVRTTAAIIHDAGGGGVEIPAGTRVDLKLGLDGTVHSAMNGRVAIGTVELSSEAIYLVKGSQRIARLKRVELLRGGEVRIREAEPVDTLGTVVGIEVLLRSLIAGGAQVHGSTIGGWAIGEIERELTKAVRDVYIQNFDSLQKAIDPFDLARIVGIDRQGGPFKEEPVPYSPNANGTARRTLGGLGRISPR